MKINYLSIRSLSLSTSAFAFAISFPELLHVEIFVGGTNHAFTPLQEALKIISRPPDHGDKISISRVPKPFGQPKEQGGLSSLSVLDLSIIVLEPTNILTHFF